MRVVVIGASGRTGRATVEAALRHGHAVTAVSRRADNSATPRPGVQIAVADVLDAATLAGVTTGADAVVSTVGPADRGPTTVYSTGAENLATAMRESGCRRLVCLSSAGLAVDPETGWGQRMVTKHVIQRMYRQPYADMARMEEFLAASDLDWTAVRVPMLVDKPATHDYRTTVRGHVPKATRITRADVADYLVACIPSVSTYGSWVEISH